MVLAAMHGERQASASRRVSVVMGVLMGGVRFLVGGWCSHHRDRDFTNIAGRMGGEFVQFAGVIDSIDARLTLALSPHCSYLPGGGGMDRGGKRAE